MVGRLDDDIRRTVLAAAAEEANRRGDARIGTEHLLLALLHGRDPLGAAALGTDLEEAHRTLAELDRVALAAVGIDAPPLEPDWPILSGRRPSLSSGGRAVLKRAVDRARSEGAKRITARHLLHGLLGCERPDPAADLLDALDVDRDLARARLDRRAA